MSNFDHTIREGAEKELRAGGWGAHTAYNFCGYVWFEDGQFHEEVWHYGAPQEIISADSLEDLMFDVNVQWGRE